MGAGAAGGRGAQGCVPAGRGWGKHEVPGEGRGCESVWVTREGEDCVKVLVCESECAC